MALRRASAGASSCWLARLGGQRRGGLRTRRRGLADGTAGGGGVSAGRAERPPPDLPFPDLASTVASSSACSRLRANGWAVVDGAFGDTWCHLLRDDIITLAESRALQLNATHMVKPSGELELLAKAGILETELESVELQRACPWIARVLADTSLKLALEAGLGVRLGRQTVKVR